MYLVFFRRSNEYTDELAFNNVLFFILSDELNINLEIDKIKNILKIFYKLNTSEYSLELLRYRGVEEYHIPKFLKNHKEIETSFLAGKDYSDLLNKKQPNYEFLNQTFIYACFKYVLGHNNRNDPDLYDPKEGKKAKIADLEFIIKEFKNMLNNPDFQMTPDERTDLGKRLIQKEKELEYVMADNANQAFLNSEFLEKTSKPNN